MKTDIYYFSGTGNSLHVAKELKKRIPNVELIPIVSLLDKEIIRSKAENVGFVFPIHLTTLPIPVKKFLEKLDLSSAEYIFAVGTRVGSFYLADIQMEKILKKKGKGLDSFFILNMARNSPCGLVPKFMPGFKKMVENWSKEISRQEILKLESLVQERLDFIRQKILSREKYRDEGSAAKLLSKHLVSILMAPTEKSKEKQTIHFYYDSDCTGCGICEKVCPSKKIKMTNKKPVWQKDVRCYFCYACFNSCPAQSILIKDKYTKKDGRYLHPKITADDIAKQKVF